MNPNNINATSSACFSPNLIDIDAEVKTGSFAGRSVSQTPEPSPVEEKVADVFVNRATAEDKGVVADQEEVVEDEGVVAEQVEVDPAVRFLQEQDYTVPSPSDCKILVEANEKIEKLMEEIESGFRKINEENFNAAKQLVKSAAFLRKQQPAPTDSEAVEVYAAVVSDVVAELRQKFNLLLPVFFISPRFLITMRELQEFFAPLHESIAAYCATLCEKIETLQAQYEEPLKSHAFAKEWNQVVSSSIQLDLFRLKEALSADQAEGVDVEQQKELNDLLLKVLNHVAL